MEILTGLELVCLAIAWGGCAPHERSGRLQVPFIAEAPGDAGLSLYWELRGEPEPDAPAVLVFHGGPGAPERDLDALPFWRALSRDVPVLYFDQRGSGRSGRLVGRAAPPARAAGYRIARTVEDAERLRRAVLGRARRVVVLGASFGAQLALLYAAAHPSQVAGLILVEPAPDARWVTEQRQNIARFLDDLVGDDARAAAGLASWRATSAPLASGDRAARLTLATRLGYTRAGQRRLRDALVALGGGDDGPLSRLMSSLMSRRPSRLVSPSKPALERSVPLRSPALYRTVACAELGWREVAPENCRDAPRAARRLDLTPALQSIQAPTLILSSRHDPIIPPALHDAVAAALGSRAQVVKLWESGHLVLQEQPQRCLAAVRAFITALPPHG